MKPYWIAACFALGACGHAGPFVVAPEPRPSLTATPAVYLQPFEDRRAFKEIWHGQSPYLNVSVQADGITRAAKAWNRRPYGDVAYLWQHSLARALDASGLPAAAPLTPPAGAARALSDAAGAGVPLLLRGRLTKLAIEKRGADALFGTNLSGTFYDFVTEADVELLEAASGRSLVKKEWAYERRFYDPTFLGSDNRSTFPGFFVAGLGTACEALAGDPEIRTAAGLPTYTPTPTHTATPLATPPPKNAPAPQPSVTATPEPLEYWVNPKTGKKVDPQWNFDPEDGTPRKEFILHRAPTPTPLPGRR